MFYKSFTAAVAFLSVLGSAAVSAETLRFSSFEPPTAFLTSEVFSGWASAVEEASAGEVKVKIFAGGTLGRSPAQQLKLVQDGVADLAFIVPAFNPGVFPGVGVGELPFVVDSAVGGSKAIWEMHEQRLLEGEFDTFKMIGLFTTSPQFIPMKGRVDVPADMKGKNIGASVPSLLPALENMGAVAIGGIVGPVIAESISRGVIDGSFLEWNAIKSFRVGDAIDHVLEVPMGSSVLMVVMNKDKFERLSPEAQAAIDSVSGAAFSTRFGVAFEGANAAARAEYLEEGKITVIEPAAATLAAWKEALQPAIDGWLAEDPARPALLEAFTAAMKD